MNRVDFAAERWKKPNPNNPSQTLMQGELEQFNFRHGRYWVWVAFAVGIGWFFLLNLIVMIALRVLNSESPSNAPNVVIQAEWSLAF